MKLGTSVVRGTLWTFLEKGGRQLLNFAFYLALARILDPGDFGVVALAASLLFLTELLMHNWINVPIVQRRDLTNSHLDTAFWVNVAMSLAFFLAVTVIAGQIAAFFDQPQLRTVLIWLAPTLILKALFMVQVSYLTRHMLFRALTVRALVASLAGGMVAVGMAVSGFGPLSLVGRELIAALATVILLWFSCAWRPGFRVSRQSFHDLFSTGKSLIAVGFLAYLSRRTIIPFVSYFMGPVVAGLFNAANRVSEVFVSVNEFAIGRVTLSAYSKVQDDSQRLVRGFYKSLQLTNIVSFPIFFGLSSVAPELTYAMLGAKWEGAIPLIQIVVLVGAARSLLSCNRSLLLACAKPHWLLYENIAVTVLYLAALPLATGYGVEAIAILFVVQFYLRAPVDLYLIRRAVDLSVWVYMRSILVPLIACAAMYTAVVYARDFTDHLPALLALFTLAGLGAATYLLAMLVIGLSTLRMLFEYLHEALMWRRAGPSGKTDS